MLAACLVWMAGSLLSELGKEADKWQTAGSSRASIGMATFLEILSAHYCLAVVTIGGDEFAAEPISWNIYTAKTFEEIEALRQKTNEKEPKDQTFPTQDIKIRTSEVGSTLGFAGVCDAATELYLHDKPTLTELANGMPSFSLPSEVEKIKAMNSWTCTFTMKAQIRILGTMGIRTANLLYVVLALVIWSSFTAATRLLKDLRPVFVP